MVLSKQGGSHDLERRCTVLAPPAVGRFFCFFPVAKMADDEYRLDKTYSRESRLQREGLEPQVTPVAIVRSVTHSSRSTYGRRGNSFVVHTHFSSQGHVADGGGQERIGRTHPASTSPTRRWIKRRETKSKSTQLPNAQGRKMRPRRRRREQSVSKRAMPRTPIIGPGSVLDAQHNMPSRSTDAGTVEKALCTVRGHRERYVHMVAQDYENQKLTAPPNSHEQYHVLFVRSISDLTPLAYVYQANGTAG